MELNKSKGLVFDSALPKKAPKGVSKPAPEETMVAHTAGILSKRGEVPIEIALKIASQHVALIFRRS